MKYNVVVGRDFPCFAAEAQDREIISINVNQNQQIDIPRTDDSSRVISPRKRPPLTYVVGGFVLSVLLGAFLLGCATGDFSLLKSTTESGRDLFIAITKFLKSP